MAEQMMTSRIRIVIGMVAVFLSTNAIGAPFVFNPPVADYVEIAQTDTRITLDELVSRPVRERMRGRDRRQSDGIRAVASDNMESEVKFRLTQSGFRRIRTVLKAACTLDGKNVTNALGTALIDRPISVSINRSGEIEKASGYDKVIRDAGRNLTPESKKRLEEEFGPVKSLNSQRLDWSLGPGLLIGRDNTVGAAWSEERKLNPDPAVESPTVYVRSRVVDSQVIDDEPVVTVLSFVSTHKDMLEFVSSEQIKSLDDERVAEFLAWNIATLPLEKYALRQVLKADTMELIETEQRSIRSRKVPLGTLNKERVVLETVKIRHLRKYRRTK